MRSIGDPMRVAAPSLRTALLEPFRPAKPALTFAGGFAPAPPAPAEDDGPIVPDPELAAIVAAAERARAGALADIPSRLRAEAPALSPMSIALGLAAVFAVGAAVYEYRHFRKVRTR